MRNRWLILVLAFSLIVNVAAIGTIGYRWWRARRMTSQWSHPHRRMLEPMRGLLSLTPEQMDQLEEQRRRISGETEEIRQDLFKSRARLMELLGTDPDSLEIEELLQEIASSQVALERKVINNILRMKQVLTPEQREELLRMMEKRGRFDRMRPPPFGPEEPFGPRERIKRK